MKTKKKSASKYDERIHIDARPEQVIKEIFRVSPQ